MQRARGKRLVDGRWIRGGWVVERGKAGERAKKTWEKSFVGAGWCEKVLEPDSQTEETDRQTCGKE